MLQKLSILHQEDENERAESLVLSLFLEDTVSLSVEAKDDIDAMTLFKMAKASFFACTRVPSEP